MERCIHFIHDASRRVEREKEDDCAPILPPKSRSLPFSSLHRPTVRETVESLRSARFFQPARLACAAVLLLGCFPPLPRLPFPRRLPDDSHDRRAPTFPRTNTHDHGSLGRLRGTPFPPLVLLLDPTHVLAQLLKVTTSYLLSPVYYSSGLFFGALGCGEGSSGANDTAAALGYRSSRSGDTQALMSSLARTQSITGSRRQPPGRDASSTSRSTLSVFKEPVVAESVEEEEHSRDARSSELSTTVVEELPTSPSPSRISDISTDSTPQLPTSPTPIDPVAESYNAEITDTSTAFAARPLSSLLSIFSYRATVCLSSFELLPDDHSFESRHEREPTVKEVEEILHERLRTEAEVVERVIEEAIEKRGVGEEVRVSEGETYFEEMKKVSVRRSSEGRELMWHFRAVVCRCQGRRGRDRYGRVPGGCRESRDDV